MMWQLCATQPLSTGDTRHQVRGHNPPALHPGTCCLSGVHSRGIIWLWCSQIMNVFTAPPSRPHSGSGIKHGHRWEHDFAPSLSTHKGPYTLIRDEGAEWILSWHHAEHRAHRWFGSTLEPVAWHPRYLYPGTHSLLHLGDILGWQDIDIDLWETLGWQHRHTPLKDPRGLDIDL